MIFHIKTLIIINILLTTAILVSTRIYSSLFIFIAGIFAMICFFGVKKIKLYYILLYKFKWLFLTLIIFQILLRRSGEVYFAFYFLKVTEVGVYYAMSSLFRYLVILLSATMLSCASPYEMIKALRTWKMPEILNIVVSFTILFLRQLQTDFKILNQNLQRRNITFRKKAWNERFEIGSMLIVPIIGKVFSDIKYKVIAMELNGYGYQKNTSSYFYRKCKVADYLLIVVYCIIILMIIKKY